MSQKKLTDKQQAFINEYLQCWNAAEAARKAGYSEATARSIGAENLTKPDIAAEIKARITEMTMSTDEALIRLSEQARATMDDFVSMRFGIPVLDLEKAQKNGKMHLLKKFKTGKQGVEIELHDVQSALVHVLKEQHLGAGEATEIVGMLPDVLAALKVLGQEPSDVFNRIIQRAAQHNG